LDVVQSRDSSSLRASAGRETVDAKQGSTRCAFVRRGGSFADPQLKADALLVKVAGFGSAGTTCLYLLPSSFEECDATYFADYSAYNTTLTAVAVDAGALGLSNATNELSYAVTKCRGRRNNRGHLVRDRRLHRREHRNVRSETERHRPRASDLAADLRRILRRRAVYREGTCHRVRRIGATRRGPEPSHRLPEQPVSPTDPDRRYDDVTSSQTTRSSALG
jgi:hypothetical protein